MNAPLARLVDLVIDDDALVSIAGRRAGIVAIPEPARAIALSALAETSDRRPIVVAVPTSADAERLAHDLAIFVGEQHVDVFPAWETLPFERVSPSVETMGSRLRTLWHLREGGERSDKLFIVAPARALVQRLGPGAGDIDPIVVGPGDQLDSTALVERLGGIGYRREYQVEHRGEFAVRGSIIDVFPSTADAPVRIDLWGDEVDRLSEFAIDDQRSTIAISEVLIFPCRELLADDEVRARAEELMSEEPWGREQWERLANGAQFDGMESWLPWLVDDEEVLFDRVAADALVVLVEPQRLRDRAADIINEEADLAASLARTWDVEVGDGDDGLPRLHVGFDRLLARCDAPVLTVTNAPDSPDTPSVAAAGFDPVVGDGSRLVTQIKQMLDTGYRVVIGAEGAGSAERVHSLLLEHGLQAPIVEFSERGLAPTGLRIVVAPIRRGVVLPHHKLAIVAETDVTGRRRLHRRARVRPSCRAQHLRGSQGRRLCGARDAWRREVRRHGHAGDRRCAARLPAAGLPR